MTPHSFAPDDPAVTEHFDEHGWALVTTLDDRAAAQVRTWVDEIAAWDDDGEWLHHREMTDHGPKLCRTENFVPFHAGLRELLTTGTMVSTASAMLGEPAVLYKEKVNYKLAGGAGYAPHQDAPAYPFIQSHVSCMIAIDDADASNGCLEVVSGMHHELLPQDSVGCIDPAVVETMGWFAVPLRGGQTLWFHSRTPHRSGPNRTSTDRRALYPTYNARREGDRRDAYYLAKLDQMAKATVGDHVQVSLIGDFQGRPV